jgi:hypothetical protein
VTDFGADQMALSKGKNIRIPTFWDNFLSRNSKTKICGTARGIIPLGNGAAQAGSSRQSDQRGV